MKTMWLSIATVVALFSCTLNAQITPLEAQPSAAARSNGAAGSKVATVDLEAPHEASSERRRVTFAQTPLSFEPNVGQSKSSARFTAKGAGYTLQLEASRALLQLAGAKSGGARSVTMEMLHANRAPQVQGEEQLPGKASYFPSKDPKTWFANIPTYSRVKYSAVYRGIDVAYYGKANRLEYDFMLQPGADAGQIRLKLAGSHQTRVDGDGSLVLRMGKDDIRFLSPVAYQVSADGKRRETVAASYQLERASNGKPALVSFALGAYDRTRPLVIDPVLVPALSYAQYVNGYAGDVTVDGSGNTYVTGQNGNGQGFYVTEFNPAGAVLYTTSIGTSTIYPNRVRVDSSGNAYVAGYIYVGATLPTGANSYKSSATGYYNGFLVQIAAGGASVPYATFMGGTDSNQSSAQGLGVQTISGVTYAFVAGWTYSSTFPTTPGVYQSAFSGNPGSNYIGWVAKFNPAASGSASLTYSTFLGTANNQFWGLAADSAGNAYVTGNSSSTSFPVTPGAFHYDGYQSGLYGVYVTKLNATGTALVYSAYLGYGNGYDIAVDGQANPSAYVTGPVSYPDFPTTPGAYQTTYAGGFVTKLSSDGSSEVYSTFLGGPSSDADNGNVDPWSIALEPGCASSCNAYVSGFTSTADFPLVNAIQNVPSTSGYSGFVAELAANGDSALFSSYLSGVAGYVWDGNRSRSYGLTPAVAVDNSGNMSVAGDLGGTADFPVTIANSNPGYAFLAKISPSSEPFTWSTPTSINFGNEPVGISTSSYGGASTVTVRNLSATPVTISSIQASPASIFSASDTCANTIPAGGSCTLALNFLPATAGTRTGTVSVYSNASDSPTVIAVTGNGTDTAFTQASATSLSFGTQNVGSASAPQYVTLTNNGDETASLSIYYPSLGIDFYAQDNCSTPLAPGASCVAEVTFTPTQAGLRTGTLYVQGGGGPAINIPLTGTGLASGATGTVSFSANSLNFGTETVGSTTTYQGVYLENNSSVPYTVSAITLSGDFSLYSTSGCGALPFQIGPQSSCIVYTTFTPSAAGTRTGNLTFTDTATGSPQSVALSGTGVAGVQTLEFYPSSGLNFGDNVPVGEQSGTITVYAQNAGTSAATIDRVLVSGDFAVSSTNCPNTSLAGTTEDGTGSLSYCQVSVIFKPTVVGLRTGTLTFIDSASGSPQTVSLSGNAIADTGTVALTPTQLDFSTQSVGTTSAVQYVYITNPGNDTFTVNSYTTGTGNFSVANSNCPAVPFTLTSGSGCYVKIQFTPSSAGTLADSLTVTGSVATGHVALSGTGVAEAKTIGFTPASPLNSGSVVVGQTSGNNGNSDGQTGDLVSIRNTGTAAVTFSTSPAIGGVNSADFSLYNPNGCGSSTSQLQPGASCPMWIHFKPSSAAAETATLTFTDDATGGTQVLTLDGTGIATAPAYSLSNNLLNFDNQVQGTTSATNTYIRFYNNSGAAVVLGNAVLSSGFLVPSGGGQTCNGQTIANGGTCYSYVSFAPTSVGLITGSITFVNSANTTLVSAPLTGYAPAPVLSAIVTPTTLNFTGSQVVTTTSSYQTTVLTNTGNEPISVGTITGSNLGAAPGDEFSLYSDECSNRTVVAGSTCTVYVEFTPNAAGARTGNLVIPVTYAGGTTASFTSNLTGSGTAEVNSAVFQPGNGLFVDQTVGVQSTYVVPLYLVNRGNLAFKVGTVSGVNTIVGTGGSGEFSVFSAQGGYNGCSGATVPANTGSCQVNVTFTPTSAGAQSGSLSFPVTFADGTTTTAVANLSGNGVAAAPALLFQPSSLAFAPEIVNNTSGQTAIAVKNIGNETVHFSSISTPSTGFILGPNQDGCYSAAALGVNATCYIYVSFAPTAAGNIMGTLTVNDNAAGGPHRIPLTGTGILASQQIAISQNALTFANQPAGSTSSPQVIYVTNQSDTTVTSISAVLSGTNTADYQLASSCSTSLGARAVCSLTVKFSPAATATGVRTASITLSDSDTGSPRTITLTGTAIAAGPAVALAPASPLTFAAQNVGTTSGTENFSVTNSGTGNLTITGISLSGTNARDFSIVSDGCSGAVLTQNQNCIVGVRFSPSLGGTRTAIASVTDNATGSPQTIGLSGTGHGTPLATLNYKSLAFANTYVGSTSGVQKVTLSNSGSDTLEIASITLGGPNPSAFTHLVTTCIGTLAPKASCTVATSFAPTAVGSFNAAINILDNANNVQGAVQSEPVSGTALSDVSVSATNINYGDVSYGATKTVNLTVSNVGSIADLTVHATSSAASFVVLSAGNTCSSGIAPGASCTLPIEFNPSSVGAQTGSITIVTNGGANPQVIVAGSGTSDVSVSSASLSFGTIAHGTTATLSLTVSNVGTVPSLTVSPAISGANPAEFVVLSTGNTCTSGVAPGSSCTLPVQFQPAAAASYSAVLTVTTNGGTNPAVSLSGTGN